MSPKIYKFIGAAALTAVLAYLFFGYVDHLFHSITSEELSFDFGFGVLANFTLLALTATLALIIFEERKWAAILGAVVGLVYVDVTGFTYLNFLGAGFTVLLFLLARRLGVGDMDDRAKFNPRTASLSASPAVIFAFLILISFASFQSPLATALASANRLPTASERFISIMINDLFGDKIEAEAGAEQKDNVIQQVARQANQQFNEWLGPYFKYAPPVLAFGLLLVLWGVSWIFVLAVSLLAMPTFWLLKKTGFVHIHEHQIKAEEIGV